MSPDDPNSVQFWEELSRQRLTAKGFHYLKRLHNDLALSQNYVCPVCNETLYNGEQTHVHHILEKSKGEKDAFSNLIVLHMPCHYKVHHSQGEEMIRLQGIIHTFKSGSSRPKRA
jgi:RNA-directed DNA polymerase